MTYLSDRKRNRANYPLYGVMIFILLVIVYFWPMVRELMRSHSDPLIMTYDSTKLFSKAIPRSLRSANAPVIRAGVIAANMS